MSLVRRYPLITFFVLAYGLSWAYWVPLALSGARVFPGSRVTHFPGLLGPALAAFIVTYAVDGREGVATLARRLVLVTTPVSRFWAYALSPLIFLSFAAAIGTVAGVPLPPLRDYAIYSGLPAVGLAPVYALVLLFNGFGEETGWRGFAQSRLQSRFGPVAGTFVLAGLWAGWHAPAFAFVDSYRQMPASMIVAAFGLGLSAGTFVLSRVTTRTGGSVLAAAVWHATYNMTSATAAARGLMAAVTTTCVMCWALVVLVERISTTQAHRHAHR